MQELGPKQELGPNQTKWLEDLETTTLPQTTDFLCNSNGYCCLSRACEIFLGVGRWNEIQECFVWGTNEDGCNEYAILHKEMVDLLALYDDCGMHVTLEGPTLASLNDRGKSFKAIAAIIREDPAAYFRRPA